VLVLQLLACEQVQSVLAPCSCGTQQRTMRTAEHRMHDCLS
jgi:hypothetical protein